MGFGGAAYYGTVFTLTSIGVITMLQRPRVYRRGCFRAGPSVAERHHRESLPETAQVRSTPAPGSVPKQVIHLPLVQSTALMPSASTQAPR